MWTVYVYLNFGGNYARWQLAWYLKKINTFQENLYLQRNSHTSIKLVTGKSEKHWKMWILMTFFRKIDFNKLWVINAPLYTKTFQNYDLSLSACGFSFSACEDQVSVKEIGFWGTKCNKLWKTYLSRKAYTKCQWHHYTI